MYQAIVQLIANPQTPPLVVLVVLVFAFLAFLKMERKSLQAMAADGTKVIDRNTDSLEENTKIQGQVLEALHRSNGHTALVPANEDAI